MQLLIGRIQQFETVFLKRDGVKRVFMSTTQQPVCTCNYTFYKTLSIDGLQGIIGAARKHGTFTASQAADKFLVDADVVFSRFMIVRGELISGLKTSSIGTDGLQWLGVS